jgi:hypothetical protein
MSVVRTIVKTAGGAAAVYSGYAALTFFRYGRTPKREQATSLDRFMPDPEVIDHHSVWIDAPIEVTWEACRRYDMMRSRIAQILFDTRSVLLCGGTEHPQVPEGFVEQLQALGWVVLEESEFEVILGVAAKPWLADEAFRRIPAKDFIRFDERGWAKIAVSVAVERTPTGSLLTTETRAMTTDPFARRFFRRYWALVAPGVKMIRIGMLRAVKRGAELR